MSLIEKVRRVLHGENKPKSFDEDDALEQFVRLGAAGPNGQVPITSYENGSTVFLSDFDPGTIMRETVQLSRGERHKFNWWCIGKREGNQMDIYWPLDNQDKTINFVFPQLLPEELRIGSRGLRDNGRILSKPVVGYKITSDPGTGTLMHMCREGDVIHGDRLRLHEYIRSITNTERFEIIEFGKRTQVDSSKPATVGIKEFVPAYEGIKI